MIINQPWYIDGSPGLRGGAVCSQDFGCQEIAGGVVRGPSPDVMLGT